jgi:hypothetical protein
VSWGGQRGMITRAPRTATPTCRGLRKAHTDRGAASRTRKRALAETAADQRGKRRKVIPPKREVAPPADPRSSHPSFRVAGRARSSDLKRGLPARAHAARSRIRAS